MNDLDLVRDLMPDAPVPSPGELSSARSRLTAAIQTTIDTERNGDEAAGTTHGTLPARRERASGRRGPGGTWRRLPVPWGRLPVPARRLAVASGAAAAAVAAIVAMVVVAPGHGQPAADHPAAASPSAQPAPTIDVAAARFLQHAAAVVQQQAADPPGPDQYVYTEDNEGGGRVERVWVSTDGNQAGLDMVWQGSRLIYDKAIQPCTLAQVELSNRTEGAQGGDCFVGEGYGPGYFPDMPANPQGLSAYLSEIGVDPAASEAAGMGSDWLANTLGKAVEEVMPFIYLTPAQQAAWYELLAQTPGFTIAHNVRLAAGQTGVGIEWKYLTPYPVAILVFNPVTFAFMGVTGPSGGASDLVRMAFVNEVGQVP